MSPRSTSMPQWQLPPLPQLHSLLRGRSQRGSQGCCMSIGTVVSVRGKFKSLRKLLWGKQTVPKLFNQTIHGPRLH